MDFNDAPEEAKFRNEARAFLEANVQPKSNDQERLQRRLKPVEYLKAAKEYQKRKAEAGFAGITAAPLTQGGYCSEGIPVDCPERFSTHGSIARGG